MPTTQEWIDKGTEPAPPAPAPEAPVVDPAAAPVADPPPADPPPAPADPAAPTKAEVEALEAWLDEKGEQKLSIPLTAMVPRKVNGVEERVPLSQALKEHQFEAAWTQNTQRLAAERKLYDRQVRAHAVETKVQEAQRKMLDAELDKFRAAQGDPEALERMSADQERLRTDPEFAKDREDALRARLGDIRVEAEAELTKYDSSEKMADGAAAYINRVAEQYPGVDVKEIQELLSAHLLSGKLHIPDESKGERYNPNDFSQFHERTVDQYFQREAAKLKAAAAPALAELDGLRKQVAELSAAVKNAGVIGALRTPAAVTTGAAPPRSPAPPAGEALPPPVAGETREERGANWVRKGRR